MPPRIRKIRHDEETRTKIQVAQIINRLQRCVMGEVELSPSQVSAAKTLLDKVLPNLQAMDLNAQTDNTHRVISEKPISEDEWSEKHSVGPAEGSATRSH